MLLGRFKNKGSIFYGKFSDNGVQQVSSPYRDVIPGSVFSREQLNVLPPCEPTKIVCVGLNYRDHAREFNLDIPAEPLLFLKPPSAVIGPGEAVVKPKMSSQVDYEGELAVVIKDRAASVPAARAGEYILGYTCANDITARDLQEKDGQWTRAKSFDTFLPLGPYISTDLDPLYAEISVRVNGELRQNSHTGNFIFNVYELVSYISQVMTLLPGDVILTGTPAGVGALNAGDTVKVEIPGIGELENRVSA